MATKIYINGDIGWDITAKAIVNQIDEAKGDLEVLINSPGGYIFDGIEIFNALKAYNKGKVTTIITGIAASMASYIALAGDEVKAYDNAVYMIHNAQVVAIGDHRELRRIADIAESLTDLLAKKYVEKTGASLEKVREMMDNETFLFGNEIKDAGFVDEIIETDESKDKTAMLAIAKEKFRNCFEKVKQNEKQEDYFELAARFDLNTVKIKVEDNPEPEPQFINEEKVRKYKMKLELYRRGIKDERII